MKEKMRIRQNLYFFDGRFTEIAAWFEKKVYIFATFNQSS